MRDTDLYRRLLGLEAPWFVANVELNVKNQRVDVFVEHPEGTPWPCPECGVVSPVYDHVPERAWRHLDSCQFMTYLRVRPPRVKCPEHGGKQARLPWADPKARFTAMFERFAIDVLRESDVLGATRMLRITWDEAWHILERAVERGQAAKASHGDPHDRCERRPTVCSRLRSTHLETPSSLGVLTLSMAWHERQRGDAGHMWRSMPREESRPTWCLRRE